MKQKVKWVGELPPRGGGYPMAEDLAKVLDKLKASPGKWFAVGENEDHGDRRKVNNRYYRYTSALRNRAIRGYEFAVRDGVLYGRFLGSA